MRAGPTTRGCIRCFCFGILALLMVPRLAVAVCVVSGAVTPCREYERTPVIFQGLVESITAIDDYPDAPLGRPIPARVAHFKVERAWKGLQERATADVVTLGQPGTLWVEDQVEFKTGERYLVWAWPSADGRTLGTSSCSLTKPLDRAAEDLAFLESLSRPAADGYVYGTVWYGGPSLSPGPNIRLADATVVLEGGRQKREMRTDGDGRYRFTGLEAGTYQLSVTVPPHLSAGFVSPADPTPVERLETGLHSSVVITGRRDCASADFIMKPSGAISGFLALEGGKPAPGIAVQVALADQVARTDAARARGERGASSFLFSARTVTAANGSFQFTHLSPGQYVVGVSLEERPSAESPYPRIFYPGVQQRSQAGVIELQLGEHRDVGTFLVPAPLERLELSGVVIGEDGAPVANAVVQATRDLKTFDRGTATDQDGRFRLTLYGRSEYVVRARKSDREGHVTEGVQRLDPSSDRIATIRLVLKPRPPGW